MKVITTDEAKREIASAFDYYQSVSPAIGLDFLEQLNIAVEQITDFPEAWHPLDPLTRRHLVRCFPYAVIYRRHGDDLVLTSVVHLRSDARRP